MGLMDEHLGHDGKGTWEGPLKFLIKAFATQALGPEKTRKWQMTPTLPPVVNKLQGNCLSLT